MGRKLQSLGSKHGAVATGLASAGNGVVGTTTKFSGDSKAKCSKDAGSDSFKKVGNIGMSKHKTAGDSRKSVGGVGAYKAKGTV